MMTYLMMTNNKGRIRGRKIKPTRKLLTLCAFVAFWLCGEKDIWSETYLATNDLTWIDRAIWKLDLTAQNH